jgi:hypothetical protein
MNARLNQKANPSIDCEGYLFEEFAHIRTEVEYVCAI